jgi:predicted phage-related endonuclease
MKAEMKEIADVKVVKLVSARMALKAQIEEMSTRIKEMEAEIEEKIGQGCFHVGGYSVSCGDREQSRFDTAKFKSEYPEVYASYCKTSTNHFFTVKELIEK